MVRVYFKPKPIVAPRGPDGNYRTSLGLPERLQAGLLSRQTTAFFLFIMKVNLLMLLLKQFIELPALLPLSSFTPFPSPLPASLPHSSHFPKISSKACVRKLKISFIFFLMIKEFAAEPSRPYGGLYETISCINTPLLTAFI